MKTNQFSFLASTALAALMCTGCSKDNAYDDLLESDGIDLTVQVGKGLTLPLGTSDKIMITELMDTAKVSQLQADREGHFALAQQGTVSPATFNIARKEVNVSPSIESREFRLVSATQPEQLTLVVNTLKALGQEGVLEKNVNLPLINLCNDIAQLNATLGLGLPTLTADLAITTKCDEVSFDASAATFELQADGVDAALISISKVLFENPVEVNVGFQVSNLPKMDRDYTLQLSNFVLDLPDYIQLADGRSPKQLAMDNLVCSAKAGSTAVETSESILSTGFDFGTQPLINQNGTIRLQSEVGVSAKASTTEIQVHVSDLSLCKDDEGNYGVFITNPIQVKPVLKVSTATFAEVTGRFNPTINAAKSSVDLNLGDKMDFLRGEGVVIDLKNPLINLELNNNCPVGLLADITILTDQGKSVTFGNVNLTDTDGDGKVSVALDAACATAGSFNTLFSPMPEHLDVTVQPRADLSQDYTLVLGTDISVSGEYDVAIPLTFNEVVICHNEQVEDIWGDDREDLTSTLGSIDRARIMMQVESTIPMDLELQVTATEYGKGDQLVDGLVSCEHILIAKETTSNIEAEISIPDTRRIGDLYFVFKGKGKDCELNANQYLRISSAKIQLPEGVKVDLND